MRGSFTLQDDASNLGGFSTLHICHKVEVETYDILLKSGSTISLFKEKELLKFIKQIYVELVMSINEDDKNIKNKGN